MRRYVRTGVLWKAAGLAAGVVLLASCGGGASQRPASSGAAGQTLARVLAATKAAGTVHIVVLAREGPYTATYSSDAGVNMGRQSVTTGDGGKATILVTNGVGYLQANAKALVGFLGVPQAVAGRYAGRWIAFRSGDSKYQQVVSGVTIGDLADEMSLTSPVVPTGKSTLDGQVVEGLRGGAPVALNAPAGISARVYFAAHGKPLPVVFEGGAAPSIERVTFSRWGEPLTVTAPAGTLPSSVLAGSGH
jgi:hypothetical protein